MKKKILTLVALIATTLSLHAQEPIETNSTKGMLLENSYLNVMGSSVINFDSDFNTYYYGSGFALQYGKWFSPTFAPQLSIAQHFAGSTYLTNISVDFLWNVSNSVNYKEDRAFSVILFTGVEAAICSRTSSTRSYPMLNIGGQLKYAINDSFDVIGELRGGVGYDGYGVGLPITDFLTAKLGFGYKFNKPKSESKTTPIAVTGFTTQEPIETNSTKGILLENSYLNVMGSSVINFDSDFNTYYYGSGFALQYGKWFSPTFAPQLSIAQHFAGSTYLTNISVDFLWNVSNSVNYKEDRAFSVILFTGVEAAICSRTSSTRSYPMLNIGGQLKYAINDSFDIIGELRGGVGYDGYGVGLPITDFLTAKLGFGYKFNKPKSKSKITPVVVTEFTTQEQECAPAETNKVEVEVEAKTDPQVQAATRAQAAEPQPLDARAQRWEKHKARMQEMGVAEGTDLYEMWRNIFEDKERVMEQYGADELIFFIIESSNITTQEIERLSPIAEKIKQNPSVVYSIEGYADATTGTASYNNKISLARANAVANVLVDELGVNRSQLHIVGKGGVHDIFEREHMNRCVILILQK